MLKIALYLEPEDQFDFVWSTPKNSGRATAQRVTYSGGDHVWCEGPNINADGKRGFVDRREIIEVSDLPLKIMHMLIGRMHEEVDSLQENIRLVRGFTQVGSDA